FTFTRKACSNAHLTRVPLWRLDVALSLSTMARCTFPPCKVKGQITFVTRAKVTLPIYSLNNNFSNNLNNILNNNLINSLTTLTIQPVHHSSICHVVTGVACSHLARVKHEHSMNGLTKAHFTTNANGRR